jgi:hypothetical protein
VREKGRAASARQADSSNDLQQDLRPARERGPFSFQFPPDIFENIPLPLTDIIMCRNIKTLANFEPPATDDEIRASALQFVRKLSGTTRPSRANEAAFNGAVDDVTAIAQRLIHSLKINAPPRNREEEARKAHERGLKRFAS